MFSKLDIGILYSIVFYRQLANLFYYYSTEEKETTECQKEYFSATKNPVPGRFVPRCNLDGSYADVQCDGSACYCVDKYGKEIIGTRTPIVSGKPVCKEPCTIN